MPQRDAQHDAIPAANEHAPHDINGALIMQAFLPTFKPNCVELAQRVYRIQSGRSETARNIRG